MTRPGSPRGYERRVRALQADADSFLEDKFGADFRAVIDCNVWLSRWKEALRQSSSNGFT